MRGNFPGTFPISRCSNLEAVATRYGDALYGALRRYSWRKVGKFARSCKHRKHRQKLAESSRRFSVSRISKEVTGKLGKVAGTAEETRNAKRCNRVRGKNGTGRARASLFFLSVFAVSAHAPGRQVGASVEHGTVNGRRRRRRRRSTYEPRGKEDEQREVSLAARAHDHCRPPVSRRSSRTGGAVAPISKASHKFNAVPSRAAVRAVEVIR